MCIRRLLLFVALVPALTFGQESYEPFLKEGKTWKYNHHDMRGTQYMYSLIVKGDTTINELAYKKIYDVSTDAYQYALREDGKKVFCQFQNSDTPKLLYDFGKNAGEIVSEEIDQDVKIVIMVISVDTVKSGDRLLRRMKVVENYSESDEIYESNYSTWIEGLGSSCGLDTPVRYPGNYNNFYSCWIGDDILGESDIFSATGIDTSVNDTFKTMDGRSISPDAPIYDLQGRRLSAAPQNGVYIQNGKKKLVK